MTGKSSLPQSLPDTYNSLLSAHMATQKLIEY